MPEMRLAPIGVIRTPFPEPAGTPIQARAARGAMGTVEVAEEYAAGLADLAGFERIWLLYWCDRAGPCRLSVTPFLDRVERGLFATRAPSRPNPIGMTPVRLLAVEGRLLRVADVDIVDGTPLLDIKPYFPPFDAFRTGRNGWLGEAERGAEGGSIADDRFTAGKEEP